MNAPALRPPAVSRASAAGGELDRRLRGAVRGRVLFDRASLGRYSTDASIYQVEPIGVLVPDLIVDDLVIVDCKVVATFNDTHMAQMIGYLKITGMQLALLINFKNARLDWKRVVV